MSEQPGSEVGREQTFPVAMFAQGSIVYPPGSALSAPPLVMRTILTTIQATGTVEPPWAGSSQP